MRRRKHIPLRVKLKVALKQLGLDPTNVRLDHTPPLALREYDEETGLYTPDELDWRYMQFLSKEAHDAKTHGKRHDVSSGDIHKIAKVKRLRGETRPKPKRKWPKRSFT